MFPIVIVPTHLEKYEYYFCFFTWQCYTVTKIKVYDENRLMSQIVMVKVVINHTAISYLYPRVTNKHCATVSITMTSDIRCSVIPANEKQHCAITMTSDKALKARVYKN